MLILGSGYDARLGITLQIWAFKWDIIFIIATFTNIFRFKQIHQWMPLKSYCFFRISSSAI